MFSDRIRHCVMFPVLSQTVACVGSLQRRSIQIAFITVRSTPAYDISPAKAMKRCTSFDLFGENTDVIHCASQKINLITQKRSKNNFHGVIIYRKITLMIINNICASGIHILNMLKKPQHVKSNMNAERVYTPET